MTHHLPSYTHPVVEHQGSASTGRLVEKPQGKERPHQRQETPPLYRSRRFFSVTPRGIEPQECKKEESHQREERPIAVLSNQSFNFGRHRFETISCQFPGRHGGPRPQGCQDVQRYGGAIQPNMVS
jgi:hypothetical protein